MNAVDFKTTPFTINNPYRSYIPSFEDTALFTLFQKKSEIEKHAKLLNFADRVADWGKALLFTDYEKQILVVGKTAEILDWGVFTTILGINGAVVIHKIYHYFLKELPIFHNFPFLLKIITIPSSIFVFFLAILEGFAELLNTYRGVQFFNNINTKKENPIEGLKWLKERYFTLEKKEGNKIQEYIDKTLPNLSKNEKAKRFDKIAEKALQIKYESLKRRISKGLAEDVVTQLNSIMSEMKSIFPSTRAEAKQRAELLMQSLTRQGRNKIIVHMIGLIGISMSLLSFSAIFVGSGFGIIFGVFDALAIPLALLGFIIERRTIKRESKKFQNAIAIQSASTSNGDPKSSPKVAKSSLTVSKASPKRATSSS